jgi:hypothetical protein
VEHLIIRRAVCSRVPLLGGIRPALPRAELRRLDGKNVVDALADELVGQVEVDRKDPQPLVRRDEKLLTDAPGWNHGDATRAFERTV